MINFASVLVTDKTDNIDENMFYNIYWKPSELAVTDFGGFPFLKDLNMKKRILIDGNIIDLQTLKK